MHISIQSQHSHVKSIRLGGKLEKRMHFNSPDAECVRWQRFRCRIDDVISEGNADVTRLGSSDAVAGSDDMTTGDQRASAPGNW